MFPEPPEHLPLAQLVSEARLRRSLSLSGAARAMRKAAQEEGTHCGATRQAVLGYERGRIPHPDTLRWLAVAVGLPVDEVAVAAQRQRRYRLELRVLASTGSTGLSSEPGCATLESDVERRELLGLFSRAAKAGLLASSLRHLPVLGPILPAEGEAIDAAVSISENYRRLWSTTPNQDLIDLLVGHLHLISRLLVSTSSERNQARLARTASETALVAAWSSENLWELDAARRHYQAALTYAEQAQDNLLQAYVAGCMSGSYWATRTENGIEAIKLVEQAKHLLPREAPSAAHIQLSAREATAYAAAHDEPAMLDALGRAEKTLDKANEEEEPIAPWLFPMNYQEINRYRGFAAASLNLSDMAISALSEGLEALGPAPTKRHAFTLSKLAEVYVQTGNIEQACDVSAEAFSIATQLGVTESVMAVRNVRIQLTPMNTTRAVRELDERLVATLLSLP